ncbi:hypothetical protein [Streptomyces thermolilacinus]|uniref:hypothetical protein n=1 Tax=Streptomyces thermolilacinus TaxID=285540 RepID=UPI00340F2A77
MVSRTRVVLGMLVLAALAFGSVALLAAMKADATWFTMAPLGILSGGAVTAHSLGWFNKKAGD